MECLTDLGVSVASEVATSLLAKTKKHVAYIYKYKGNLKALEDARAQLDSKRTDGSRFSEDTKRRLKDVGAAVSKWQSDADKLDEKADNIISKNNILCINLWSRYSTSKHASVLSQEINEMIKSAPDFGTSFDHPIAEGSKYSLRGYMDFNSRLTVLNGVLEELKAGDVSMCSICGMGGIGKTTMAKKVVKIVEADRLFDKVALVTVSQNPNLEKIQNEIVEVMGLKVDESTMPARATKLNDWLSNNRTLLVLDDVWWQIHDDDFENVGIPLATKGCKIVFTSRNLGECIKMGSRQNFCLEVLDGGEARDLFVQSAEKCFEDSNLQDTARKIVDECNGLPVAIITVARALKDKPAGVWYDSLLKLQSSTMEKLYSPIQLSYDLLNDQEAQSFLRLCCLFPEDYDVPIEKLIFYGWGLELFKGVNSLKKARYRVDSIIDKLKKSFLLLDGEGDGFVKLHDIVRDFAIMVSSKDEHPYLVRCGEQMEMCPETCQYEKCSAISIVCNEMEDVSGGLSVDLRCPNLKLLQLHFKRASDELPVGFCDGMEDLRVVDLEVPSTLPGLVLQKKLRSLLIDNAQKYRSWGSIPHVNVREILDEGNMRSLEIFSLSAVKIFDFPLEIGQLCNLRYLGFRTVFFEYMPPGVLSNLVKLEELRLWPGFKNWGLKESEGNRTNASLDEIVSLPISSIAIGLPEGLILAEKLVESLTRFEISIGRYKRGFGYYSDLNILLVEKSDACNLTVNWVGDLIRKCDVLILEKVRNLKYLMFQQLQGNSGFPCTYFSRLRTLELRSLDSLEELFCGPYLSNIKAPCFTNLTAIKIWNCLKLKHLFPLSVATELRELRRIDLYDCKQMDEVFCKDQVDDGNQVESIGTASNGKQSKYMDSTARIMEENTGKAENGEVDNATVLPRLRKLRLDGMYKLRRIHCNGNHVIAFPSLEKLKMESCYNMEDLYSGSLNAPRTKKLYLRQIRHLKNIKGLHLEQDNGISPLTDLTIQMCYEMECLATESNLLKIFFSGLQKLCIEDMESMKEIWHGPYFMNIQEPCFSNLTSIVIQRCPKLKRVFPLSVAVELRQLQVMVIHSCKEIEGIFDKDQVDDRGQVESSVELGDPVVVNQNDDKSTLIVQHQIHSFVASHQTAEENVPKAEDDIVSKIVFPQLKKLELQNNPKLRVFYSGNEAIELSSLEEISVIDTCKIEAFCYGSLNAPKLTRVRFLPNAYLMEVEDLNAYLKERMSRPRW